MLNKNGGSSIGSGGSASGSGLKGSVTVVTANIINCNSHHETEGKIPSHNGTATGALSLQVNTANGEIKRTTLFTNYYPEVCEIFILANWGGKTFDEDDILLLNDFTLLFLGRMGMDCRLLCTSSSSNQSRVATWGFDTTCENRSTISCGRTGFTG